MLYSLMQGQEHTDGQMDEYILFLNNDLFPRKWGLKPPVNQNVNIFFLTVVIHYTSLACKSY